LRYVLRMKDVYFYNFFSTPISTSNSNLFTLFCCYKVVVPVCVLQLVYILLFIRLLSLHVYCSLFTLFCLQSCYPCMCTAVYLHYFVYKVVVLADVLQFIYIILFTRLVSLHVYCCLFTLFCLQGCCPCMCTAVYSHYFVYKVVVLACVLLFIYIILFIRLLSLHVYCSLFTLFCLQGCCTFMCTAVYLHYFVYKVVVLACVLQLEKSTKTFQEDAQRKIIDWKHPLP